MYHCNLHFYLTGHVCEAFNVIKEIKELANFTHTFSMSEEIKKDELERADVILANLEGLDIGGTLDLLKAKNDDTELIVLAGKAQLEAFKNIPDFITDIWELPISENEAKFRFKKWQEKCKLKKDFLENKQFLDTTINSVPNLIWYKTKDGLHEKVNDSFCKTVGKTKEQVEGRDHYYIWDVTPEEAGTDCMDSDMEVMKKKITCVSEENVNTSEGARLMTTYKSPLYDLDGSVMGTVGIGIDVTQEKAYEKEILDRNRTMETIFMALDCGVLCHSLDGKTIISINNAALKILGYESEEALLATDFDMVVPNVLDEDKSKLREAIKSLKNEGDSNNVEYRVIHDDGELLHVMGNIKLVKENGELFYQRFLLDCTEQKLQEKQNQKLQMKMLKEALLQANNASKAKSDFLSNMSHDIRTPMNAIVGFTTLALSNLDSKEVVQEYLRKIVTSSNHLLELLNNVLDMNRIESGKMQLEEVPCRVSGLVNELGSILQSEVMRKNIDFKIITDGIKNENIFCDKLRLHQVLLNILSNAVKYTNKGGDISFRVIEKPGALSGYANYEFIIKDSGIGMDKEFLERAFDPFEREYNTTMSGVQGTGLGLAISKNIVDMMNGTINIKSEQGVGTEVVITVSLRLNIEDGAKDMHGHMTLNSEYANMSNDKFREGNILLAEDNDLNQEIAVAILEKMGYTVDVAENGLEAVNKLEASEPGYYQLVIMDIQMPVMNGYEASCRIRCLENKELSKIPILAMTANAFDEDKQNAIKSGMNGHIAKPIDVKNLIAAIDKCLAGK